MIINDTGQGRQSIVRKTSVGDRQAAGSNPSLDTFFSTTSLYSPRVST